MPIMFVPSSYLIPKNHTKRRQPAQDLSESKKRPSAYLQIGCNTGTAAISKMATTTFTFIKTSHP